MLTLKSVALGASNFQVVTVLSVALLVPMAISLHAGAAVDRRGYKPIACAGLLLLLTGCAVLAVASQFEWLYPAAMMSGAGYMLAHVSLANAIAIAAGNQVDHAHSRLSAAFSASSMLSPLATGLLADQWGLAVGALTMAAFIAVSLVLLARAAAPARPSVHRELQSSALRLVLFDRHVRAVLFVTLAVTLGWELFAFVAPLHAVRTGLSATAAGTLISSFSAGALVIRVAWLRRTAGHSDHWQILVRSLLVTAVAPRVPPSNRNAADDGCGLPCRPGDGQRSACIHDPAAPEFSAGFNSTRGGLAHGLGQCESGDDAARLQLGRRMDWSSGDVLDGGGRSGGRRGARGGSAARGECMAVRRAAVTDPCSSQPPNRGNRTFNVERCASTTKAL